MHFEEDDLFRDDKGEWAESRPLASARIHSGGSNSNTAVSEENDEFYEKLGESLQRQTWPNVRFSEPGSTEYFGLEYPASTYNRQSVAEAGQRLSALSPRRETNDYTTNLVEDATIKSFGEPAGLGAAADDPFGDDDSLFSDADDELLRRPTARARDVDDDDFTPRLNYSKTIKRARLVHGNYVIDAPVPRSLLNTYVRRDFGDSDETAFVRYSGVTCGPSNFGRCQYTLRQQMYAPARATEIMVCVTMYNEDELLLGRTLQGVFENVHNLSSRTDPVWGDGSWKKITVVIVNDGRSQLHERTQKLLTALGVYQEGYAKSKVNQRDVRAHVYEYTSTVGVERVSDRVHLAQNRTPVQLVFCLKEKNARKINSHRWCLQAFAPVLSPKVVMLLDCGTKPEKNAFYHLWSAFKDPNVAGACGEMRVGLGPGKALLSNPLVAAQNFEYKISNVLDKPMESVFGFISVLPGAFSAYRWDALLNVDGQGPLEKYFKGEFLHETTTIAADDDERALKERNFQEAGLFTSNMYLAEDRILCFELVAKRDRNYVLRYVSAAKAETDVPETIDDFVLQRRRWLNGSLFAAMYSIVHWTQIWRTRHSLARKLWLQLEFYYHLVTVLVSWFSLSSFFLVFRILTKNLGSPTVGFALGKYISTAFLWIYVACVVCTFVLAFGNTPRGTKKLYYAVTVSFAVLMAYLLFGAVYLAINTVKLVMKETSGHFSADMLFTNGKFRDLVVSMVSTYLLYAIGAVIHGEPSFMFTSFAQYLLLSPSYVNVLNIYSFCNIHDVSWGNRDTPQAKDLGTAKVSDVDGQLVMMVVPGSPDELEKAYVNTVDDLKIPAAYEPRIKSKKERDDSYYAFIRTVTVLVWMLTNAILVAIVLAAGGKTNNVWNDSRNATVFLTVILWVVCALAAIRLMGSVVYVFQRMGRPLRWWIQKRKTVE